MPISNETAGAYNAAANNVLNASNTIATASTNKKTRKWNEQVMQWQRDNALADWNMQNEYNSPEKQMERLKKAGLNPNLVYGNGATAQSDSMPRSTEARSWSPMAPQAMPMSNPLAAYVDLEQRQATIDNLRASEQVSKQNALYIAAQIPGAYAKSGVSQVNERLANALEDNSLQVAEAGLKKRQADIQFTLDENARKAAANSQNIQESLARIKNLGTSNQEMKARINNLEKDARLKELDITLKEKGVQPGDPIYYRVLSQILGGGTIDQALESLTGGTGIKKTFNYIQNIIQDAKSRRNP